MKKIFLILALVAALTAPCALSACSGADSGETVPVQIVSLVADTGSAGLFSRYSGLVVAKNEISIEKNSDKTVKECLVKEGDEVTVGQVLFTYDMEAMQLSYEKAALELEQLKNTVTTKQSQLSDLYNEKKSASSSDQLSYTIEIQSLEAEIKEDQYNITVKEKDLERMAESLNESEVVSTVDGRVKSIDEDGIDDNGNAVAYMTIVETGNYRIKGTVNELNVQALYEGVPVIVRSRLDETVIWTGVIETIDWDNPVTGNSNGYVYYSSDEMTTSTKYPFYVTLDSTDGLILGQHVYIEPDVGQLDVKTGLWLPAYFVNDADASPWVWAANARDKLEKRAVELGQYDAEMDEYEILSGLELTDYIAMPDASLKEGLSVTYYDGEDLTGGSETGNGSVVIEEGAAEGVYDESGGAETGADVQSKDVQEADPESAATAEPAPED